MFRIVSFYPISFSFVLAVKQFYSSWVASVEMVCLLLPDFDFINQNLIARYDLKMDF
jgi:hypothetical protein